MLPFLPLILAAVLFGVIILNPSPSFARNAVNDRQLVKFDFDDVSGRVVGDPEDLWNQAQQAAGFSFSFDEFLLATMASSEYNGYSASQNLKAAVMHVALNNARRSRKSLRELLVHSDGFLGEQAGRYAATRQAPRLYDVLIAQAVVDGRIKDPTGGAIQFDDPSTADVLHARNPTKFKSAEQIAAERISAGRKVVLLAGEDPSRVRFWA